MAIGESAFAWVARVAGQDGPLYAAVVRALEQAIEAGDLQPGDRLPAQRDLAARLGVDLTTVTRAYAVARSLGLLEGAVGRGTYVADTHPRLVAERRPRPTAAAPARARLSRRGSETVEHAGAGRLQWGAFTPGVPELRMFPVDVWRRLQSQLWRKPTPQQLTYATGHGDPALKEAIAQYLQGTRGAVCSPEQVIVTSGTQQLTIATTRVVREVLLAITRRVSERALTLVARSPPRRLAQAACEASRVATASRRRYQRCAGAEVARGVNGQRG